VKFGGNKLNDFPDNQRICKWGNRSEKNLVVPPLFGSKSSISKKHDKTALTPCTAICKVVARAPVPYGVIPT